MLHLRPDLVRQLNPGAVATGTVAEIPRRRRGHPGAKDKRMPVNVRLPKSLVDQFPADISRTELVEEALRAYLEIDG